MLEYFQHKTLWFYDTTTTTITTTKTDEKNTKRIEIELNRHVPTN